MKYKRTTTEKPFRAFHLLLFLIICAVLWFLGNIAILSLFNTSKHLSITELSRNSTFPQSSSFSVLFRRIKHVYTQYSLHHDRRLPDNYNKTIDNVYILVDWFLGLESFTIDNYKSLESIFSVYPNSMVRCVLVLPNRSFHSKNKQLSKNQFIKYNKLGFNIKVNHVSISEVIKHIGTNYSDFIAGATVGGQTYVFPSGHVPYHLLTYMRVRALYKRGGIYSDFSFFFLGPLYSEGKVHEV